MKAKLMFTAFMLKALLIITCIIFGFSSFIVVNAQSSIVGKWKEVSVKQFFTTEGTKQIGKSVMEKQMSAPDKLELEFKSDHTYIQLDGHTKYSTTTGTWSVSGNQLTMIAPAEQRAGIKGRVSTFSITGNTMIKTMIIQPPYNAMVSKQEDTMIRM